MPVIAVPELPSAKRTGDEQVEDPEPKLDVRDVLPLSRLDVLITRWSPLMSTVSAWEWAVVFMTDLTKLAAL